MRIYRKHKWIFFILAAAVLLLMVDRAQAGENAWTANGPYGVRFYGLAIDPNNDRIMYASTPDGPVQVYKSIDGGETWLPSSTGLPTGYGEIFNFAFDDQHPGTVYVAYQAGVYKSTDYGATWNQKSSYDNHGTAYTIRAWSISSSPVDGTLYAGAYGAYIGLIGGVFRSRDGGETWELVADDAQTDGIISAVAVAPSAPHIIYAGGYARGGVFKSTDSGDTWTRADASFGVPPQIYSMAVDPNNAQTVYIGTHNGIYKTTNGGQTWSPIGAGLNTSWVYAIAIDPGNQQVIYIGGSNGVPGVYSSTDNTGQNWTPMMNGMGSQNVYSLAIDHHQPQNIFAGTQNGIWKYTITSGPADYGVSINAGALYVNQTGVSLSFTAPSGTTDMMISNDGGFSGAAWEKFAPEKTWSITSYGSNIISRIVYAKFRTNGHVSGLYQDDILLDKVAPTGTVQIGGASNHILNSASPTGSPQIPSPSDALPIKTYLPILCKDYRPGFNAVNLLLSATDDLSGVSDMIISNNASFNDIKWESYGTQKEWWVPDQPSATIYVKFRDRAGNESITYTVNAAQ